MPQLEQTKVRVSRQTVRILWWAYAGAVALSTVLTLVGTGTRGETGTTWSIPVAVCLGAALVAAIFSYQVMMSLPGAGHQIFDTVGDHFELAIRNLFLRFVLAGGAATGTGLVGAVTFALGANGVLSLAVIGLAFGLLLLLRQRVAPLVHYLA